MMIESKKSFIQIWSLQQMVLYFCVSIQKKGLWDIQKEEKITNLQKDLFRSTMCLIQSLL